MPEVAARAHLRWIVPVLDEAWADAGCIVGRRRRRGRHLRPRARRLAARRHQRRQDARVGPRQAARRGQPPRGPRLRGLARRPGRARRRRRELPARRARRLRRAHVPRRDDRPPHLPRCSARRSTTRRARRSTRSAGCSASAIRAARRSIDGGRGRDAARPRLPAGVARRLVRLLLLRAQDGRATVVDAARAEAGIADEPEERSRPRSSPSWPGAFQDAVVDVLVTKTIRAAARDRRPLDRARRRRRGEHGAAGAARAARPRRSGIPLIVPRPGLCTDNGAMIGAAGARRFAAGERAGLDLDATPSLPLATRDAER